jgi:hypothetical protein
MIVPRNAHATAPFFNPAALRAAGRGESQSGVAGSVLPIYNRCVPIMDGNRIAGRDPGSLGAGAPAVKSPQGAWFTYVRLRLRSSQS